jgi:methionyl-tRNA synthetase
MSKSTGNVVNPFHAIDTYGVDTIRYYLAHDGGINHDADYNNSRVVQRYKELQGVLGNLASRLTRGKGWNIRNAIVEIVGSGELAQVPKDQRHIEMWHMLRDAHNQTARLFKEHRVSAALQSIMRTAHEVGFACQSLTLL